MTSWLSAMGGRRHCMVERRVPVGKSDKRMGCDLRCGLLKPDRLRLEAWNRLGREDSADVSMFGRNAQAQASALLVLELHVEGR